MARGASAHSAPGGGPGSVASGSAVPSTKRVNAIWVPSGDHATPLGTDASRATGTVAPVSMYRTMRWRRSSSVSWAR